MVLMQWVGERVATLTYQEEGEEEGEGAWGPNARFRWVVVVTVVAVLVLLSVLMLVVVTWQVPGGRHRGCVGGRHATAA